MNKNDFFKIELEYIKNNDIKDATLYMINKLPDYFFEIPAASTGKYHPKFAASDHGLVKHTKVAVKIAYELLNDSVVNKFTDREKDLIIMALILHDGLKSGIIHEKYTRADHPILISDYIVENKDNFKLSDSDINILCKATKSHMGPWNTDYKGNEILPVPKTALERFVHMCDFLASRKFLNVEFDNINIIE